MPVQKSSLYYERAGRILAEADAWGPEYAARRNKITQRTIFNYRQELPNSPELAAVYLEKMEALTCNWADEISVTLKAAMGFLKKAVGPNGLNPKNSKDAQVVIEVINTLMTAAVVSQSSQGPKVRVQETQESDQEISPEEEEQLLEAEQEIEAEEESKI